MPFLDAFDAVLDILDSVIEPTAAATPPGFRTLLFTDLESSTALTQSLGDAKAQEVVRHEYTIVGFPIW